ncbi:hypothetical protein [Candidatus Poriferisodalis sp.]|uniref:hypothetical protein n=1 Tax=Candidatus Poriferisodalis sp. TaxID=3101277 RepID=UPI003B02A0BB
MTADYASLLAAGIPKPIFYAWSAILLAICVVSHFRNVQQLHQLSRETEAKLQRLEQRMDDYERRVNAEMAQIRAELDAYGVWSDANDRFFHHGLVAVSHMIGARAVPERRACAAVRAATQERRATETVWRPKPARTANSPATLPSAMRARRRAGT